MNSNRSQPRDEHKNVGRDHDHLRRQQQEDQKRWRDDGWSHEDLSRSRRRTQSGRDKPLSERIR